jgi:hypothetical protein
MKNILLTLKELLREKDSLLKRTLGIGLSVQEMSSLFLLCLGLLMGYGLLLGAQYNALQAVVSAVKLPILFILTTAICFPTLYMFLSYLGIKQGFKQILGLLLICLTYISLIVAAFAPVTFFFLITTDGYEFYKFLNIIIIAIGGFIGIRLFYSQMLLVYKESWVVAPEIEMDSVESIAATFKGPAKNSNYNKAIKFTFSWALLFAIIGSQLSYSLSPFFADPSQEFLLLNDRNGNFFMDVIETILRLAS